MSYIDEAQTALQSKLETAVIMGSVKFEIEDEGSLVYDNGTVEKSDAETDVTLTATSDDFREMFSGDLDPAGAFMSGRLKIDGDMAIAMSLAQALS